MWLKVQVTWGSGLLRDRCNYVSVLKDQIVKVPSGSSKTGCATLPKRV